VTEHSALYSALKALHILGVVFFLGGLVAQIHWKLGADRSGDAGFAAKVHRRIRRMDAHLVGPGALVTFAAGYAMVRGFGRRIGETPFALWGLILMFSALALWWFGMRRAGEKLAEEAEAADLNRQPLGQAYAGRSVLWLALGFMAVGLVVAVAVMMVFKFPGP
jgi:uncharacterized membrane protein